MDAILMTIFSHACSWMKMFQFIIKYHWSLFPMVQLTNIPAFHWFRSWLGAEQATSHYLNQWWPRLPTYIGTTWQPWVQNNSLKPQYIGMCFAVVPVQSHFLERIVFVFEFHKFVINFAIENKSVFVHKSLVACLVSNHHLNQCIHIAGVKQDALMLHFIP